MIDLHTHTTCSDGEYSPVELLRLAAEYGLEAISITDHDTVAAYAPETWQEADKLGLELVPGIEMSSRDELERIYHIIGLFIDPENAELLATLAGCLERRREVASGIMKLLQKEGWEVDLEAVLASRELIAKPHITRAVFANPANKEKLLRDFGVMPTEGQFIEATMILGKPCYAGSAKDLSPTEAIKAIKAAGGLAILAHPGCYVVDGQSTKELAEQFLGLGIDGFESISVVHDHDNTEVDYKEYFSEFAERHGLVISGGSDFHQLKGGSMGMTVDLGFRGYRFGVPYSVLSNLKKRLAQPANAVSIQNP